MKGFMKFSLAALCTMFLFAACEKETPDTNDDKTPEQETPVNPNPENPGEEPENPGTDVPSEPELVISDNMFEGYYHGEYYTIGRGNASVNFIEGSMTFDGSVGEYVGTGTVVCIDLNIELQDDPDHAVVPAGTYVVDTDMTYAVGTWGLEESYILKVVNDEVIYEGIGILDYVQIGAGALSIVLVIVVLPAYFNAVKNPKQKLLLGKFSRNKVMISAIAVAIVLMAISSFIPIN